MKYVGIDAFEVQFAFSLTVDKGNAFKGISALNCSTKNNGTNSESACFLRLKCELVLP